MVAYIINYAFAPNYNLNATPPSTASIRGWRVNIGGVWGVMLFIHSFLLPETDAWKELREGRLERAASSEYSSLKAVEESNVNGEHDSSTPSWGLLFSSKGVKWVIIAVGLAVAQQLTGINTIIYYSPNIFADAHVGNVLVMTLLVVGLELYRVFLRLLLLTSWETRCSRGSRWHDDRSRLFGVTNAVARGPRRPHFLAAIMLSFFDWRALLMASESPSKCARRCHRFCQRARRGGQHHRYAGISQSHRGHWRSEHVFPSERHLRRKPRFCKLYAPRNEGNVAARTSQDAACERSRRCRADARGRHLELIRKTAFSFYFLVLSKFFSLLQ